MEDLLAGFQKGGARAEGVVFKKYFQPLYLFAERIKAYLTLYFSKIDFLYSTDRSIFVS